MIHAAPHHHAQSRIETGSDSRGFVHLTSPISVHVSTMCLERDGAGLTIKLNQIVQTLFQTWLVEQIRGP